MLSAFRRPVFYLAFSLSAPFVLVSGSVAQAGSEPLPCNDLCRHWLGAHAPPETTDPVRLRQTEVHEIARRQASAPFPVRSKVIHVVKAKSKSKLKLPLSAAGAEREASSKKLLIAAPATTIKAGNALGAKAMPLRSAKASTDRANISIPISSRSTPLQNRTTAASPQASLTSPSLDAQARAPLPAPPKQAETRGALEYVPPAVLDEAARKVVTAPGRPERTVVDTTSSAAPTIGATAPALSPVKSGTTPIDVGTVLPTTVSQADAIASRSAPESKSAATLVVVRVGQIVTNVEKTLVHLVVINSSSRNLARVGIRCDAHDTHGQTVGSGTTILEDLPSSDIAFGQAVFPPRITAANSTFACAAQAPGSLRATISSSALDGGSRSK